MSIQRNFATIRRRSQRGYTLIDLAMSLTIIGLLLSGVAAAARVYMKDKQISQTRDHAKMVSRALENYVLEKGHFPCPAPLDSALEDADYGDAIPDCATVASGAGAGAFNSGVYIESTEAAATKFVVRGMVPFAELNLPEFYVYDGYGNRLQYAVTVDQTDKDTFIDAVGGITVMDSTIGASAAPRAQQNHYLLISSGPSEEGAWSRFGAQVKPCGTGQDAENCNTGTTGNDAKAIYASRSFSTADGANRFDDIIVNNATMHKQLWRANSASDGRNIETYNAAKQVVIKDTTASVMPTVPANIVADELKLEVVGEARSSQTMTANYCVYDNAGRCFDPRIMLDPASNELNCGSQFMYGIQLSAATCREHVTDQCGSNQYFAGLSPTGVIDCRLVNFTPNPGPTVVVGSCGADNHMALESMPTALCTSGSASAVSGSGPWLWTCSGAYGGASASCIAYLNAIAVTGSCGPATGGSYTSAPSSNLCSDGAPGAVTLSGSQWQWQCTGSGGGGSTNCSASYLAPVNGTCGAAHNSGYAAQPGGGDLCSSGTASSVTGTGPWTWTCTGSNGGSNSGACVANKTLNGVCGTANGVAVTTAPTSNLCSSTATPATATGTGPWNWNCTGEHGGNTVACSAPIASTNGVCGTAHGVAVATAPTTNLCSSTATPATATGSGPWNWTCTGQNGGSNANCTAPASIVNPVCGAAHGAAPTVAPPTATCAQGVHNTPPWGAVFSYAAPWGAFGPYIWQWHCQGTTGNLIACSSRSDGVCDTDGQCTIGTPTMDNYAGCGMRTWQCQGILGGATTACAQSLDPCTDPPVDGVCNNASPNNCHAGIASGYNAGTCGGNKTWTCMGEFGGNNDSCANANPACPPVINGDCGSSDGTTTATAPSSGLCTTGTPTTVTGSGPWNWSCTGQNGGTTDSCSASPPASLCWALDGGDLVGPELSSVPTGSVSCSVNGQRAHYVVCNEPVCASVIGNVFLSYTCGPGPCNNPGPPVVPTPVNGVCGGGANTCNQGSASGYDAGTCGGSQTWTCLGQNGGSNSGTCSIANAQCPVAGVCGAGANTCNAGSASGYNAGTCGGSQTWTCLGQHGGANSGTCSIANAACVTPVNGECGAGANTCNAGAASGYNAGTCGGSQTWTCLGQNGGSNSGTCSIANAQCPVAGVCGAGANTCNAGSASGYNAGTCGGSQTWTCLGQHGGANSGTCSIANAACPINGDCGSADGTTSSTAPSSGYCDVGSFSGLSGSGPWTWSCSGQNGGAAANCSAAKSAPVCTWQPNGNIFGVGDPNMMDEAGVHCGGWELNVIAGSGCTGCQSYPSRTCIPGGVCDPNDWMPGERYLGSCSRGGGPFDPTVIVIEGCDCTCN